MKSNIIRSDLKQVDKHIIQPEEYDEIPELMDEMFDWAIYMVNGVEQSRPKRRGLQKAPKKIPLQLRLPAEVVEYFKSEGAGWQTRVGIALQEWILSHPH